MTLAEKDKLGILISRCIHRARRFGRRAPQSQAEFLEELADELAKASDQRELAAYLRDQVGPAERRGAR